MELPILSEVMTVIVMHKRGTLSRELQPLYSPHHLFSCYRP